MALHNVVSLCKCEHCYNNFSRRIFLNPRLVPEFKFAFPNGTRQRTTPTCTSRVGSHRTLAWRETAGSNVLLPTRVSEDLVEVRLGALTKPGGAEGKGSHLCLYFLGHSLFFYWCRLCLFIFFRAF